MKKPRSWKRWIQKCFASIPPVISIVNINSSSNSKTNTLNTANKEFSLDLIKALYVRYCSREDRLRFMSVDSFFEYFHFLASWCLVATLHFVLPITPNCLRQFRERKSSTGTESWASKIRWHIRGSILRWSWRCLVRCKSTHHGKGRRCVSVNCGTTLCRVL